MRQSLASHLSAADCDTHNSLAPLQRLEQVSGINLHAASVSHRLRILALASLCAKSCVTSRFARHSRGTRALAFVKQRLPDINALTQRAQRRRLSATFWHWSLVLIGRRCSEKTPARRLIPAATSPSDPYSNTAQLRQLGLVLGVADYKELQSLLRLSGKRCAVSSVRMMCRTRTRATAHLAVHRMF